MKIKNLYILKASSKRVLIFNYLCLLSLLILSSLAVAQQDPQYTQYMYNTMSINPGYAGSNGDLQINALARMQWAGIDGAPRTQILSADSPLGHSGLGLGLNIVNDKLGPSSQQNIDANVSYTITVGYEGNLSFGLRLGGSFLNIDWSKSNHKVPEELFGSNISKFFPTVGAGLYYYTDRLYLGLSVPNFIPSDYYDKKNFTVVPLASYRLHYYLMGGYVFDLSYSIKFKPAVLLKYVSGAPLSLDISANFLFYERFTAGVSYRWDNSISALLGFQVTNKLTIGYAYDLATSNLRYYNSGTHEVMLRYQFREEGRLKSPRFF